MRLYQWFILLLGILVHTACQTETNEPKVNNKETTNKEQPTSTNATNTKEKPLFESLKSETSGVHFINEMKEAEGYNILTYEYLYNGAGLAVGDINNDGLPDLFFASNLRPDQLLLNKGNCQFQDISQTAGILAKGFSTGVTMADVNADGLLDIYVCRSFAGNPNDRKNQLFINNGDLTFIDKAAEYNLANQSFSHHANFFDYDNDGDLDLYLLNHRRDFGSAQNIKVFQDPNSNQFKRYKDTTSYWVTDKFFKNEGNRFVDVTEKAGIKNRAFGLSATITDINQDGWMDIFIGNDYVDKDFWYINNKNGTFSDRLEDYLGHISRNSMGTDIADFNNDGLVDQVVVDMLPEDNHRQKTLKGADPYDKYHNMLVKHGGHHQVMRNMLQLNRGDGRFAEIGALAGISHTDWSWTPLFADFDNDGWKDLFISNGYLRDITNLDFAKYTMEVEAKKAGGFDKVNKMNLVNQIPSQKIPNYIFKNNGNLTFTNKSKDWGFKQPTCTQGAVYADLDNDGDLDIITNNLNEKAKIYKNLAIEQNKGGFLRVKLKGAGKNTFGVGAQLTLTTNQGIQYQEMTPNRGYFSAVEPIIHFGLGKSPQLKELKVRWPSGKEQVITDLKANTILEVLEKNAKPAKRKTTQANTLVKAVNNIKFDHKENEFVDFKREPLLPHQFSNLGPDIAIADVNGDQKEDFFIGGAAGQAGQLFLQKSAKQFQASQQVAFSQDANYEDTGLCFFDADQDGDQDLYIVSGGNAWEANAKEYQDRLYINDGKGNFSKASESIPVIKSTGSCVIPLDYDADGDLDLFVGGKVIPNQYPYSPQSTLLRNDGGKFVEVAAEVLPKAGKIGMVSDAHWLADKKQLVIVGEWMPITILAFQDQKFKDITNQAGLTQTSGWWNCISAVDIDQDGDLDFLAGNRGLNSYYKANPKQPASIYAKDFDGNGDIDAIPFFYYNNGRSYTRHTRDELFKQLPSIRKKFNTYRSFADVSVQEIFSPEQLKDALQLQAHTFASVIIENKGNGKYELRELPVLAQAAPVHCIQALDVNNDQNLDLLLSGNNDGVDVETGRYDAMGGLILLGDGKGNYEAALSGNSGFKVTGDARYIGVINETNRKESLILVTNNGGPLQAFQLKK